MTITSITNKRVRFLGLYIVLVGGALACTDTSRGPTDPGSLQPAKSILAQAPTVLTMDETWAQLAETELPGFAGIVAGTGIGKG